MRREHGHELAQGPAPGSQHPSDDSRPRAGADVLGERNDVCTLGGRATARVARTTPIAFPLGAEAAHGASSERAAGGLKPSLLQALRTGFSVFATLSRDERSELQLRTRKRSSFRKLAATHGLPASTLWRSLAAYLLYRRCPEISRYRHVGISHISLILDLEEEAQLRFLHKTEIAR